MKKNLKFLICLVVVLCSSLAAEEEQKKPIRVYADMVGDLFHAGHIEFIKKARAFGDYLIVGVISDEAVEEYKRTPVLHLDERVAIVRACKYVDEVIGDSPLRLTEEWLKEHQIDYVVHGDDYSQDLTNEHYGAAVRLGIFRTVPYTPGISTTEIIQRVVDRHNRGDFSGD